MFIDLIQDLNHSPFWIPIKYESNKLHSVKWLFLNGMLYCLYFTTLKHVHYHFASDLNISATSFKIPCLWVAIASLQRSCWHGRITITCWRTFCGCLGKVRSRTGHEGKDWSRFIALLIHNLCSRNGLVVTATPRTLYPRERNPVPVAYEAPWASWAVCTGTENLEPGSPSL
jgi:hypothetical protein